MQWLTVRQYAVKNGISNNVTYKRIRQNKLKTKKVKGVTYIAFDEGNQPQISAEEIEAEENKKWNELQEQQKKVKLDLQIEKLKNLRQDTILKMLKQQSIKEKYRMQYCEGVLVCFADAFSDLKNFLIELKLDKEKIALFQRIFQKDLKKFQSNLKQYIAEKDREDEVIEDVEQ